MKKAFTLIELLIVVAIIAILAAIAVPNFLEAQTRAKVSRVVADMRSYATALETYFIDVNSYPIHWPRTAAAVGTMTFSANAPTKNINDAMLSSSGQAIGSWNNVPSFAATSKGDAPIGLTSPISYLNTYSNDAFAAQKQATFAYATGPSTFLIWSPGPDGLHNLDGVSTNNTEANTNDGEWVAGKSSNLPNPFLIAGPAGVTEGKPQGYAGGSGMAFTYDATNGTASSGDVYRTK